jgi:hypothetical protein
VAIVFESFELEDSRDTVCIYNDLNGKHLLEEFTGSVLPAPVISESAGVLIRFSSDGLFVARGFMLSLMTLGEYYRSVLHQPAAPASSGGTGLSNPSRRSDCNSEQTLNEVTGMIDFFRVGSLYAPNLLCVWRIRGAGRISLTFGEQFELEDKFDFVKVYHDPAKEPPRLLQSFTGNMAQEVRVPHGDLIVVFSSDGSIEERGFRAIWSTALQVSRTASPMFLANLELLSSKAPRTAAERCGRSQVIELRGEVPIAGGILSDGPHAYPPDERCSWTLRASGPIILTFLMVDLESGRDIVKVFGGMQTMRLLATVSGTKLPPPIRTPCKTGVACQMLIQFESDLNVQGLGFDAQYALVEPEQTPPPHTRTPTLLQFYPTGPDAPKGGALCTGLQYLTPTLQPQNFGTFGPYGPGHRCQWLIRAGRAGSVRLRFRDFNLQSHHDTLRIFTSTDPSSSAVETLTGNAQPADVVSSSVPKSRFHRHIRTNASWLLYAKGRDTDKIWYPNICKRGEIAVRSIVYHSGHCCCNMRHCSPLAACLASAPVQRTKSLI